MDVTDFNKNLKALINLTLILTFFLINCKKKTNKFIFLVILIIGDLLNYTQYQPTNEFLF